MPRLNTTKAFADGGGTVSSTALALTAAPFSFTAAQVDAANRARITNTSASVVLAYRYTGSAATAANHQIPTLQTVVIEGNANLRNLSIIRVGGSDGAAWVTLEE